MTGLGVLNAEPWSGFPARFRHADTRCYVANASDVERAARLHAGQTETVFRGHVERNQNPAPFEHLPRRFHRARALGDRRGLQRPLPRLTGRAGSDGHGDANGSEQALSMTPHAVLHVTAFVHSTGSRFTTSTVSDRSRRRAQPSSGRRPRERPVPADLIMKPLRGLPSYKTRATSGGFDVTRSASRPIRATCGERRQRAVSRAHRQATAGEPSSRTCAHLGK